MRRSRKMKAMSGFHYWWKSDPPGERSHVVGMRLSDEEAHRIEQLRRLLRMRSASEVLRFALQVVECACADQPIQAQSADEVVAKVEAYLIPAE